MAINYIDTQNNGPTGGPVIGNGGNNTFNLTTTNGPDQIHAYGEFGNDVFNIKHSNITGFTSGQHNFGDFHSNITFVDTFHFQDLDQIHSGGVVVGRLDDFDGTRDIIKIEGDTLDLENLSAFSNAKVADVRVVEFNGAHNDPNTDPQQWLLIEAISGGKIFYALEGARVDLNGNGGANQGQQEKHFIGQSDLPNFNTLNDVEYQYKYDYYHGNFTPVAGGATIVDIDKDISDIVEITGTAGGDVIAAGLNDDTVSGYGGNDSIWGGSGDDTIYGNNGDDWIFVGAGKDRVVGGNGNDTVAVTDDLGAHTIEKVGNDFIFRDSNSEIASVNTVETVTDIDDTAEFSLQNIANLDMSQIRDFDGNNLGQAQHWDYIGSTDIQNDGDIEHIYFNTALGRWATVGTDQNGNVNFGNHSWGGDTRVVGTYVDPLVANGTVAAGSPQDSQARFAQDLHEGSLRLVHSGDYDGDGAREIYFAETNGNAFLRAVMHGDGNIQYANYQSAAQVDSYLSGLGYGQEMIDMILV
ncbi:MAG: hypothetical protein AAGP08_17060 [Pseudomonadota bacterium]